MILETTFVMATMVFAMNDEATKNMKAYPPADKGMARFVLKLPKKEDETLFQIELQVGKTMEVDQVNRFSFGGKIEKVTVKGWGFPKFVVDKLGPLLSTRAAADPNLPKLPRFIPIGGEPFLVRYNSRLPLVVYVPEDAEVRYRIWSTTAETTSMKQD